MNFKEESNYHKAKVNLSYDGKAASFNASKGPVGYSGVRASGYKSDEISFDVYNNDKGSVQMYGGSDNQKNKSFGIRGSFNF